MPPGTEALLAGADVVAGGRRACSTRSRPPRARQVVLGAGPRRDAASALAARARAASCVLASGDPGLLRHRPRARCASARERLDVHPAPSSVALAFARLGLPWDDALVVSAHGRDPRAAINTALRHPKVAILTEPRAPAELIVDALAAAATIDRRRGARHARRARLQPPTSPPFAEPNVVDRRSSRRNGRATVWPPRTPDRWALPEDAFEHRAGMITKAEVRAVALAALGPGHRRPGLGRRLRQRLGRRSSARASARR